MKLETKQMILQGNVVLEMDTIVKVFALMLSSVKRNLSSTPVSSSMQPDSQLMKSKLHVVPWGVRLSNAK